MIGNIYVYFMCIELRTKKREKINPKSTYFLAYTELNKYHLMIHQIKRMAQMMMINTRTRLHDIHFFKDRKLSQIHTLVQINFQSNFYTFS